MTTINALTKNVNGVAIDDLSATVDAIKANGSLAAFKFRVRNQWTDGAKNTSVVDGFYGAGAEHSHAAAFVLEADEPGVLLGKNSAANPVEYLLHALAACLTTSMVYHAAARGIQIQEIESELRGDIDLRGFLKLANDVRNGLNGINVNFKIKADASEEQLQAIGQLAPDHSPVYDSLTKGVAVTVTTERL
jgi:uncharacterized OsmC-like protein